MSEDPITAYIDGFSGDVADRLRAIRAALRAHIPDGQERISYRMPALFCQGVVVYYAAFKKHIGLYPPVANDALRARVAPYAGPKGNLQFPHDEPLPLELILAVATSRLAHNRAKAAANAVASAATKAATRTPRSPQGRTARTP